MLYIIYMQGPRREKGNGSLESRKNTPLQAKTLSCTSFNRELKKHKLQAATKKADLIPPWEQSMQPSIFQSKSKR